MHDYVFPYVYMYVNLKYEKETFQISGKIYWTVGYLLNNTTHCMQN